MHEGSAAHFTFEGKFPSTRYTGSKSKLTDWIWSILCQFKFDSCLDAFGGTGSVAYMFKRNHKKTAYNDVLRSNYLAGRALIENPDITLSQKDMDYILRRVPGKQYPNFIATTYQDVYFIDSENRSCDTMITNLREIQDEYKAALGYFALFQTCIIKRPYNLFHRKNLYLRTADVARSFGNKSTWDKPMEHWFRKFVHEANSAVFDNFRRNKAYNLDVMEVPGHYDLIYIDPPYMNARGVSVDYREFYHFLEGLTEYDEWGSKIDYSRKHLPLRKTPNPWLNKSEVLSAFDQLFRKFSDSILAVSYRSDGIPPISSLKTILKKYKKRVDEFRFGKYQYVLSANKKSEETLLVGD